MNYSPPLKMDVEQYFEEIYAHSARSRDKPHELLADLCQAFKDMLGGTLIDSAVQKPDPEVPNQSAFGHRNMLHVATAVQNCFNSLMITASLSIHDKGFPLPAMMVHNMTYALNMQVCSCVALTIEQIAALQEWCGPRHINVLEVYGGSGYNAAILNAHPGISVVSTDISPISSPDLAGCDTDEEREQLRELIAKKKKDPTLGKEFFHVEKLDSTEAVEAYAKPKTVLLMCYPPTRTGIVENTIRAFHAKGGQKIVLVGCERLSVPCPVAMETLRSLYELVPSAWSFSDAVPIVPSLALISPKSPLPIVQFYERKK